jgi:5,5'-dehydrodivanillate O-demethylase
MSTAEGPSSGKHYAIDMATTKPDTPGGVFVRQFWHAVARGKDLPRGRATPLRIMNEDFTLYRGHGGRANIIANRCPHRGALMRLGWIEGDDIRCVYHGWKFSGSGQCVDMPAEARGFDANVRIKTYPAEEAYGLIYAYFGPGEPPPFPPYPESPGEGFVEAWPVQDVPCNYLQSFENTMDEVHVAFTHAPGASHATLAKNLPIITAEETGWGMIRYGTRMDGSVRHTLHFAPNIVRVIVPPIAGMDGVGGWPEITFHMTPVDDENHLWLISAKVPVCGAELDAYKEKRTEFYRRRREAPPALDVVKDIWAGRLVYDEVRHPELAIVQDIAVQAGQGAIQDRESEYLGRSDRGIVTWRRILRRELQAIAEGRPVKKWVAPPAGLVPIVGPRIPCGAPT